jgi:magnesium-transporting ATPase (P-type)
MGFGKKTSKVEEVEEEPLFPWHAKSIEECLTELKCPGKEYEKSGLTSVDATKRLEEYGPNELSEKEKVTLLQRIWKQVANVLVGVLVFVAIVSGIRAATADDSTTIVTNWIQVGLIIFVITVNTIM